MSRRIGSLDLARGIAILGTLATNIWIMSHPGGMLGYLNSFQTPGAAQGPRSIELLLQQLANGKFLGLLTLMFGIGLAIQADSAQRAGRRWPGPYLWRAALLLLDGLLHYLLVAEFDVLMGYAVTGAIVAYIIAASPRTQRVWMVVTAAVHVVIISLLTATVWATDSQWGTGSSPDPNPYREGSWWDLVLLRIDNAGAFRTEIMLIMGVSIAMFTLGNRLYRAGLFQADGRPLRRRLMLIGLIALPIDLGLGLAGPAGWLLARYITAPLVALGLLALIASSPERLGWTGNRLAALGKVALSGYVLQNVLASILFYGWGFDLGGVAPNWRLPVTVLAFLLVSGLILVAANLWLRRFHRGPIEWLWVRGYQFLSGEGRRRREDEKVPTPV